LTLTPGTRLGPYEIVAAIGAGGMGEVYRARDAKLNRDVALKIVSGAFIADPDRLARFRREAQVLASLNHPNIAAIYGFEDSGATHALVLELVEGPTLADRIAEGPIALVDAIPIAKQLTRRRSPATQPRWARSSAPPPTCRQSRQGAGRSTSAPTSGRLARSSTK